ncbi:eukaryotic translation initiation factor 3 subunit D [Pseudomyrmex gracilis]|uniref:eukaryotic translation initiation factor 3 subunit D n=1 Tax=Pseudomyrmex gracilis TaxID=219809 RepID=UPI0009950DEC|nr:eukaryotic translation initiation factor 3 subunit D [Pseudomyrmex gracilis]
MTEVVDVVVLGDVQKEAEVAHFHAPAIQHNPDGWGPCELPDQFKDIPYQPFSKGDRLGKISDWTAPPFQDKKFPNKYTSQFGTGSQYAYYHDEDETTFHLVDTTRVQKPPYQRGRFRHNQRNLRGRGGQRGGLSQMQQLGKLKLRERERKGQAKRWGRQQGLRNHKNQPPIKIRDASVTVRPDWSTIEEMDFPRLAKLSLPGVKDGEDIMCCGSLEYYDKTYDRVNVKNEKPLQRIDRIFHTVTTTDDPIIRKLSKTEGNVYATDAILATIMCCTRSNYSWDIVIEKIGDKLFFDKRDNTEFDLLTVNETSVEPPQDDGNSLNSPRNLALEATFINHNFSQQVLKSNESRYKFEEGNPFISEEEESDVASVAYRYRKWDLNNGIVLVARCEHDAVMQGPNNEIQFLTIKALNEWDSKLANGVEWRQKLDTQRGAVLANELRNNACKLAKWTVQALLAGSDQLKFGYVSRAIVRDSSKHVILGTQQYKPNEFATQINLNMDNAWGILRCIIDICMKQKDGKYLIMKDPNKPMIRLYDIPDNTFESEGEEDEDDDEPVNDAFQS